MRKLVLCVCLLLAFDSIQAQYYYKDIVSNRQVAADMASYKEKKIREIKLRSYEFDGQESDGFFCEKRISRDYKKAELFTKAPGTATSLFTSVFNNKGDLATSTDSSEISLTHNFYNYDEAGNVKRIASSVKSSDDDFHTEIFEEHLYEYNEQGLPTKMTVVKNRRDSTIILFLPDEKNNVSIEKDTKSGSKYYYYYDERNRLTDVVHANEFRENLVAVYLFEYDGQGNISQMTTTEEGTNNYYIWRYNYDNGLRSRDRLFAKDKKLMGRIEYEYK